jgi:hypothetical protein
MLFVPVYNYIDESINKARVRVVSWDVYVRVVPKIQLVGVGRW